MPWQWKVNHPGPKNRLVLGKGLYGKVDRVPGLCYVATRFLYVWFIPLIPEETFLVLATPGECGYRGLLIPRSLKSALVGWLRGACLPVLVISGAITTMALVDLCTSGHGGAAVLEAGPWFVVSTVLIGLSYRFSTASPRRAAELGAYLGIPEDIVLGLLTPSEDALKDLEAYLSAHPDALATAERVETGPAESASQPRR